jgi:LAO/AO transport system kinase
MSVYTLQQKVIQGDERALSRALSLVEDRTPEGELISAALHSKARLPHIIGITGAPGAGKSTLVDALARALVTKKRKVGVLAIDPTSPFSGGAILGDRIRMMRAEEQRGIYIRSMATRGALGGVSRATYDAAVVLGAAGYGTVIIETVGVGQAEIDIVRTAHTVAVVLVPGMGDSVQSIKAGILEIADLFVINKADRDGVESLHRDLKQLLSLSEHKPAWMPPIVKTVASEGKGIDELVAQLTEHRTYLAASKSGTTREHSFMRALLLRHTQEQVLESILAEEKTLAAVVRRCVAGEITPREGVRLLSKRFC